MNVQTVTHTLANGLRIHCEVMPRVRSSAIGFLAAAGSRDETPPQHGVSHFLEHMCFKGTRKRDWRDITVRFDELGSIYNAFTGKEHTMYYGWTPSGRAEEQLELLADMMRPALPPDEFETERKVILEEIAMSGDSFDHHVWNYLHETVFGQHPLAHEILGERETIADMPRQIMVDYHAQMYAPNNLWLVATGAVDPDALFKAAERYCGDWAPSANGRPKFPPPPAPRPGVASQKLDQFQQQTVAVLYPSVASTHEDSDTLDAFCAIFGGSNSRCYWNIVQEGVCASAGAAWLNYLDSGMMALYADGEPEQCEAMLTALRNEARKIIDGGVTADEIQRVKNQQRTRFALEGESPRTRLMQIVDDLETIGRSRSVEERLAAVDAVSDATIRRHFEQHPITGPGLTLTVGPREWSPEPG